MINQNFDEQLEEILNKCESPIQLPEQIGFSNGKEWAIAQIKALIANQMPEEIYSQVAGWFKFPYRKGMGVIKVPVGIDKNMPQGGIIRRPKMCEVCGSRLVYIRPEFPRGKKRKVCPTCAVEILESLYSNLTNRQAQSKASPEGGEKK